MGGWIAGDRGWVGVLLLLQVDPTLTHLFCELEQVWKTQIVDDISRPDQHRAPVLLEQLEVIRVGAVPVELTEHLDITCTFRVVTIPAQVLSFQGVEIVGPMGRLLFSKPILASATPKCHCKQGQNPPSHSPKHCHDCQVTVFLHPPTLEIIFVELSHEVTKSHWEGGTEL